MSEGELIALRSALRDLSEKSDRQHAANQESQRQDREAFNRALQTQQQTFADAMNAQRNAFQEALNKQFTAHFALDKTVDRHDTLLENIIGDGQPGQGRLGLIESTVETLKKFRWQALAVIGLIMWAAETFHRGH